MLPPIPDEDREHILQHTTDIWPQLSGARLFITGGTGFYGKWILEAVATANDKLGTHVSATILSRNPGRFASEVPHLASRPEFEWLAGNTADFTFPVGRFDYVFHLATAAATEVGSGSTATILENLRGTQHVLDFASFNGVKRLLYASSGAIYGPQPAGMKSIPEDYPGAPDPLDRTAGYGEMKRMEEHMCVRSGVSCVIARGFSFLGPYLPLSDKFAVGCFIRDALTGGPIQIRSDGTARRGYLYAADLAIWLLAIIVKGCPGDAYNVGSDEDLSLYELAVRIAGGHDEVVLQAAHPPNCSAPRRYVPAIDKCRSTLALGVHIPLATALLRTMDWASTLAGESPPFIARATHMIDTRCATPT